MANPDQMPGNEDVFAAWNRPAAGRGSGALPVVIGGHGAGRADEIDDGTLTRLLPERATVLLHIRERDAFAAGARSRAINIPFDEVEVRAGAELPRTSRIIVDCSQEETSKCRFAGEELASRGFTQVSIFIP